MGGGVQERYGLEEYTTINPCILPRAETVLVDMTETGRVSHDDRVQKPALGGGSD